MFSKVYNFFGGLIQIAFSFEQRIEHDVEAIIGDFTATVAKLEDAAVAKAKQADEAFLQSMRLSLVADALKAEGVRAQDVAAKIKALVS
jgi:hypothetical protein